MRKVWSKWTVIFMASTVMCLSAISTTRAQGSVSLQVFYDELQPYGHWMDHGRYGYVWMPNVDPGFVPYGSNGYWVNTSYGNTWVSDYSWGWAPFHYGRWFYDDYYGWLWVPDTVWAPAWVTWRSGGGYYGWAPLMPGYGINVSVGYYNQLPYNYWNFVPYRYVMYRHVYTHCVPRPQIVNVINNTTIVNNNYNNGRDRSYFTGPSRSEIENRNHERVPVYNVNDRNRPGRTEVSRSSVSIYKPEIDNSPSARSRALPSKVYRDERGSEAVNGSGREVPAENSVRRQRQLDDTRSNDAERREGAMPSERSSELKRSLDDNDQDAIRQQNSERLQRQRSVESVQREQEAERSQRQRNVESLQRDQNAERLQREQNAERLQRQNAERVQREQSVERQQATQRQVPTRQLEQPRRESSPARDFNPQPRQQSHPDNNRSVQPAQRQPQVQRSPERSQSATPAVRHGSSSGGSRRGID